MSVSIPGNIHQSLKAGARRIKLQHEFNISEQLARYYCRLFDEVQTSRHAILICADMHFPYHSPTAIKCMLEYAEEVGIQQCIVNGDLVDFYDISRWKKEPERLAFDEEIELDQELIYTFTTQLHKIGCYNLVCIEGNHEERLEAYLALDASKLYNIQIDGQRLLTVPALLQLEKCGWQYYQIQPKTEEAQEFGMISPYQLHDFSIVHGHEKPYSGSTVNICDVYYRKLRRSFMVAHSHRSQSKPYKLITGTYDFAYAMGCLCQLYAKFARINDWNHGFLIMRKINETWIIENIMMIQGTIVHV